MGQISLSRQHLCEYLIQPSLNSREYATAFRFHVLMLYHDAGMSTAERVAAFDQDARELIGEYNRFEIEQYGYEFPV